MAEVRTFHDAMRDVLRQRRDKALAELLTGEHIEAIEGMVVRYDGDTTPNQVAVNILNYLATHLLEPLRVPENGDT